VDQQPEWELERNRLLAERDRLTAERDLARQALARAEQRGLLAASNSMLPLRVGEPGTLAGQFGAAIRISRLALRMTQEELSKLSGVGVKSISQIENGANATLNTAERLAKHVGIVPTFNRSLE
jgi:DNA-binding XRE family transcriptional regulator